MITFFKKTAQERNIAVLDSDTAIQSIVVGDLETTLMQSKKLQEQGYWVYPMRPPSVPENQSLLRITLNTLHTETHIIQLLDALS